MKRPLVVISLALMLGIIIATTTQSLIFLLAGAIFIFSFYFVFLDKAIFKRWLLVSCLIFYFLGGLLCIIEISSNLQKAKEFSDNDVKIYGKIAGSPDVRNGKVMYTIKPYTIEIDKEVHRTTGKILVTSLLQEGQQPLDYGCLVKLEGFLKKPDSARNPGAFDYRKYLYQKDIWGQIYLANGEIESLEDKVENPIVRLGLELRKKVVSTIEASVKGQQGDLLNGMLIGYTSELGEDVEEAFRKAGLSHIMAVSGANIAFIVLPLIFLLKKAGMRKRNANILISIIVILFVFTTGFEPSVTRAAIMALTMLAGGILMRETDVYCSLAFAAVLMLLINPFTLYNIGFQLSFGATISLVVFYPAIKRIKMLQSLPSWISETLAATLAAQIGVLPISLLSFNTISIISIISNVLVVPLTGVVTIVGLIGVIIGQVWMLPSILLGYLNYTILTYILWVVKLSAMVPFATITTSTPGIITIILYYFIAWFILMFKPARKFKLPGVVYGLALFIIISVMFIINNTPKLLETVILDVGSGDSIFLRSTAGRTVLIDGGGHITGEKGGRDIGAQVVAPFLLDMGVSRLDVVIASHGHADHIQGLEYILQNFQVGCFMVPYQQSNKEEFARVVAICKNRGIKVVECKKGDEVNIDSKTVMHVLSPIVALETDQGESELVNEIVIEQLNAQIKNNTSLNNNTTLNNTSLVLKLVYSDFSLLLTGDIEKEVEEKIINSRQELESDIIKVAHHGSKSSSHDAFIDKVKAKVALISVGKNNFGHPSRQTLDVLRKNKVKTFRTDLNGAITIKTDGKRIDIIPMLVEE